MKKVINGKMYNTETAKEIFDENVNFNWNATRYSVLYKKKNGEFFMVNYTRWQNERNVLYPVTEAEAKKFIADEADGDLYEEVFGTVEE